MCCHSIGGPEWVIIFSQAMGNFFVRFLDFFFDTHVDLIRSTVGASAGDPFLPMPPKESV
jgi:hypothetical protein